MSTNTNRLTQNNR